ncbi:cytochrome c family protein [Planktotalea sp.]|uniref:cytochrome c family protein n=1 Tax=Planktotalea sp. TaxID=2029877 RepID=UPI003299747B
MFKTLKTCIATLAVAAIGTMASADSWTLDGDNSRLAFGSVKKDTIGEVHSFEALSGMVGADGAAKVEIDLTSVQTNIDIRNERFNEHVFKGAASAALSAEIDMDEIAGLAAGSVALQDIEVVLSFLGQEVELDAEVMVARLSDGQVMVTSNDMIYLSTVDLGINAGVDKLMELAKLPGITRTVPITFRLMFNMDEKKAEAAPAAPVTTLSAEMLGDVKAGKKVFKKCKACHEVKEGKNKSGPSLYKIVNAPAGQVSDFRYSKAMAESGLVWDVDTLSAFLAKPKDVLPKTKMAFPGLKKDADIANVIAYIVDKSAD